MVVTWRRSYYSLAFFYYLRHFFRPPQVIQYDAATDHSSSMPRHDASTMRSHKKPIFSSHTSQRTLQRMKAKIEPNDFLYTQVNYVSFQHCHLHLVFSSIDAVCFYDSLHIMNAYLYTHSFIVITEFKTKKKLLLLIVSWVKYMYSRSATIFFCSFCLVCSSRKWMSYELNGTQTQAIRMNEWTAGWMNKCSTRPYIVSSTHSILITISADKMHSNEWNLCKVVELCITFTLRKGKMFTFAFCPTIREQYENYYFLHVSMIMIEMFL